MDELMTIPEAAAALRLSQTTVRRMVRAGALPAIRSGQRKILIKKKTLERYVLERDMRRELFGGGVKTDESRHR